MSVDDLVSANLISASRGEQILGNAIDAGVSAVRRYRGTGKQRLMKHAARNFKKSRLKNNIWPKPYIFEAPVYSRKLKATVQEEIAMWLPLDLLDMIWQLGLSEIVLSTTRMDATSLQTLNEMKS